MTSWPRVVPPAWKPCVRPRMWPQRTIGAMSQSGTGFHHNGAAVEQDVGRGAQLLTQPPCQVPTAVAQPGGVGPK
jgi:hypothetical protein